MQTNYDVRHDVGEQFSVVILGVRVPRRSLKRSSFMDKTLCVKWMHGLILCLPRIAKWVKMPHLPPMTSLPASVLGANWDISKQVPFGCNLCMITVHYLDNCVTVKW